MGNLSQNIKIGNLDRKVTIQSTTISQSSTGSVTETTADLATVWAKVESKGKSEKFVMDKETVYNKKYFTIRYRADFDENDVLVFDSKSYDILSINEIDGTRKRFLEVEAERRE